MYKIFNGRYIVDSKGLVTSDSTGLVMAIVQRQCKAGHMLVERSGWGSTFFSHEQLRKMYETEHAKIVKVDTIRTGSYLVGSKNSEGGVSFTKAPKVHATEASAKTEAARVAGITPGTTYIVVKIIGEVVAGGVKWN